MLLRAGLRYHWWAPWQSLLALLGIALGVATVVAVQLANASAERAFTQSAETLQGDATHRIVAGSEGVPESLYRALRREGVRPAAPVVEGFVRTEGGRTLRILGIDAWAEWGVRDSVGEAAGAVGFETWLTDPAAAVLFRQGAARLGVEAGDVVSIETRTGSHELHVVRVSDAAPRVEAGMRDTAVVDVATAQAWLGERGRLTRIDLRLPDQAAAEALEARLQAEAPETRLQSASEGGEALDEMTAAFRLNLTAFSLLALLVGALLIYNAVAFSVVRRRGLFGRLRVLGVSRRRILGVVLLEGVVLGAAGIAVGLPAGWWLAHFLLEQVTRTISDLYFVLEVQEVALDAPRIALAVALGGTVSVAAALAPALEAARVPARETLQRIELEARARRWLLPLAVLGGVSLLLGALSLYGPIDARGGSLISAFGGVFLLLCGFALVVPAAVAVAIPALTPALGWTLGVTGRMACRSVASGLSRSGVAATALVVAVAAVIGVSVMIDSFRHSLEVWLDATLAADVYVSAPSVPGEGARPVAPEWPERLAGWSEVAAVGTTRYFRVQSATESDAEPDAAGVRGEIRLRIHELAPAFQAGFQFRSAPPEGGVAAFNTGEAAWITEPFASRTGLQPGDAVALRTPEGPQELRVEAVVADYTTSQGAVLTGHGFLARSGLGERGGGPHSVQVHLAEGAASDRFIERLEAAAADGDPIRARADDDIRRESLAVFDRTFAVTEVLRVLTVIVAAVGVFGALLALALERLRETALLRAIGLLPRQVWGVELLRSGLLGALAGTLAIAPGLVLAHALTTVINQRAFGWTLSLRVEPALLLEGVAIATAAALLAGLFPAWRAVRCEPAQALRGE